MPTDSSRNSSETSPKSDVRLGADRVFSLVDESLRDKAGRLIPLRRQSAQVLAALIASENKIVSKDDLIAAVWGKVAVTDDSLGQCIADIRKVLDDDDHSLVRTFPRRGYMLETAPPAETPSGSKAPRFLAGALLVAVLAGFAVWFFLPNAKAPHPTVAVLAFDDLSAAPERGYFSDAISEGIITELARFSEFDTVARNSSFAFRDKPADVREIGETLGATHVLEGSQQKDGEALLVTAQLIDAETGKHVWAETYSGEVGDLLQFQGEIVAKIASTAGGQVAGYVPPQGHRGTVTAIHLHALGIQHLKRSSDAEVELAKGFFEQAIEADPTAVWGPMGMGFYYRYKANFSKDAETKETFLRQAERYAGEAAKHDPNNYATHYLIGRLKVQRGDMDGAILKFEQAKRLNPSASHVLVGGSSALLYTGRDEEGIADIRRAMELDPLHPEWYHWQLGWGLWQIGECDEAHQSFLRMSSVPPMAHRMWAAIDACRGDTEAARERLNVFLEIRPEATLMTEREQNAQRWTAPGALDRWIEDMRLAGMPEQ